MKKNAKWILVVTLSITLLICSALSVTLLVDTRVPRDKLLHAYLGNAKEQYELSLLYGDLNEPELYKYWMRKAAYRGYSRALHHYTGESDDPAEAQKLIERAANNGDFYAQIKMASSTSSVKDARAWAVRAASSGEYSKQLQTGDLFANTSPPDYQEAYYWRSIGAVSYEAMGRASNDIIRERYKQKLTPEQIAAVDERVKLYKPNVCISPEDGLKYTCFVCSDSNGNPPC